MDIASRFPTEILEDIFLQAIDGPISNIRDNHFPWALDRVCKSWRSVFITYPDLWTWITIDIVESHPLGQDSNANQCLSLCLERSRNYPLNISLHLPARESHDKGHPTFALVWKTFLSCSQRWRMVYLEHVPEPQFFALNSCRGATPILESLAIYNPVDYVGYCGFAGFQIAPYLTRFTLRDQGAMLAVQKWSIPWMQLTHLVLGSGYISEGQLFTLVTQLRDIEELCLILEEGRSEIEVGDLDHNPATPQCLQRLRVLQACCLDIFGFITAPSLSELYLEGSEQFYPIMGGGNPYNIVAKEILNSFIKRSSCQIQKLTLSDFSELPFTPLVELFPDVVDLCLIDALGCLEDLLSPDYYPGLRVLDCTARIIDVKYFIETLLKILKMRNSSRCSVVPLAKVIFRSAFEKASPLVTTDWVSFDSHIRVGSCCELNLHRDFYLPEN